MRRETALSIAVALSFVMVLAAISVSPEMAEGDAAEIAPVEITEPTRITANLSLANKSVDFGSNGSYIMASGSTLTINGETILKADGNEPRDVIILEPGSYVNVSIYPIAITEMTAVSIKGTVDVSVIIDLENMKIAAGLDISDNGVLSAGGFVINGAAGKELSFDIVTTDGNTDFNIVLNLPKISGTIPSDDPTIDDVRFEAENIGLSVCVGVDGSTEGGAVWFKGINGSGPATVKIGKMSFGMGDLLNLELTNLDTRFEADDIAKGFDISASVATLSGNMSNEGEKVSFSLSGISLEGIIAIDGDGETVISGNNGNAVLKFNEVKVGIESDSEHVKMDATLNNVNVTATVSSADSTVDAKAKIGSMVAYITIGEEVSDEISPESMNAMINNLDLVLNVDNETVTCGFKADSASAEFSDQDDADYEFDLQKISVNMKNEMEKTTISADIGTIEFVTSGSNAPNSMEITGFNIVSTGDVTEISCDKIVSKGSAFIGTWAETFTDGSLIITDEATTMSVEQYIFEPTAANGPAGSIKADKLTVVDGSITSFDAVFSLNHQGVIVMDCDLMVDWEDLTVGTGSKLTLNDSFIDGLEVDGGIVNGRGYLCSDLNESVVDSKGREYSVSLASYAFDVAFEFNNGEVISATGNLDSSIYGTDRFSEFKDYEGSESHLEYTLGPEGKTAIVDITNGGSIVFDFVPMMYDVTISGKTKQHESGDELRVVAMESHPGSKFIGWYDGTDIIGDGDYVRIIRDTTITEVWISESDDSVQGKDYVVDIGGSPYYSTDVNIIVSKMKGAGADRLVVKNDIGSVAIGLSDIQKIEGSFTVNLYKQDSLDTEFRNELASGKTMYRVLVSTYPVNIPVTVTLGTDGDITAMDRSGYITPVTTEVEDGVSTFQADTGTSVYSYLAEAGGNGGGSGDNGYLIPAVIVVAVVLVGAVAFIVINNRKP